MKEGKNVILIELNDILPNRFQPRIKFNEKSIIELSESIKEHGVIQPIIVRKISDKYEIIAGERRYKASVLAGKTNIPSIVVDLNDKDSSEIALIENVQREDLTAIEEAISYRKILDMGYLTQEALATKLGIAQSTIANKLRLLNLDDDVQEALLDGKISERHARSLLKLSTSKQKEMLDKIIKERLTVRKTDEVINNMINNKNESVLDSLNANTQNITPTNEVVTKVEDNPFFLNQTQSNVVYPQPAVEELDFGYEDIKAPTANISNIPNNPIVDDTIINSGEVSIVNQLKENNYIESTVPIPQVTSPVSATIEQPLFTPQEINNVHVLDNHQTQQINNDIPQQINNVNTQTVIPQEQNIINIQSVNQEPISNEEMPVENQPMSYQNRFFTMMPPQPEEIPVQQDESNILNQTNYPKNDNLQSTNNLSIFNQNSMMPTSPEVVEIQQNEVAAIPSTPVINSNNGMNIFNSSPVYPEIVPTPVVPEIVPQQANTIPPTINESVEIVDNPQRIDEPVVINEPEPTNTMEDEIMVQPIIPLTNEQPVAAPSNDSYNLRDVINKMRKNADEIEAMGFEIDTEEFDFDDIYQVIFKIKK